MEKRKNTKNPLEIATKLARLIAVLDKMVFEENSVKEIVIVRKTPKKGKRWIQYVPKEKGGKDFYEILGYLDELVVSEIESRRHISAKDLKKQKSYEDLQSFTEEEFLMAIAAHEVRHRIQCLHRINLFSPEDANYVKNSDLKCLIEFLTILFKKNPPNTAPIEEEFDAKTIEYWVAKKWHKGSSLLEIAKIVKSNPKNLRENNSPFFILKFRMFFLCRFPVNISLPSFFVTTQPP